MCLCVVCVWYMFTCVCRYAFLCMGVEIRERHQVSCSIVVGLISLRQGLSLNVELGLQDAIQSNPLVSTPP